MENIFVSEIKIEHVRHLKDLDIVLSKSEMKHLILTGKNGSGKTSVLDSISKYINSAATSDRLIEAQKFLQLHLGKFEDLQDQDAKNAKIIKEENDVKRYKEEIDKIKSGIEIEFNPSVDALYYNYQKGNFILAYYKADRIFKAEVPKHVEKIILQDRYLIDDEPHQIFVKYLLDLKVTEALAKNNGNTDKAESIEKWFLNFENLLKNIFEDDSLKLIFDEDNFKFMIQEDSRDLFDFNTLSSGFAAILDIVLDLMMRMEKSVNKSFSYDLPGIVLIDEIETHLHLELQKTIVGFLTSIFPNIQFIMSTHSPFIINSLDNVVIYDLENNITVKSGLTDVPYDGIVEGYFNANLMSNELKAKFDRYKELVKKENLSDDDFDEIAELEMYLNEIPDFLAINLTTEYQQLKVEFENREDI